VTFRPAVPRLLIALSTALVLGGCATRGTPFDVDSVTKIQRGKSTEQDVQRWFGTPTSSGFSGSGRKTWRYLHEERRSRDTGTITKIGRSVASIFGMRVFVPPVDVAFEETTRHRLLVVFGPDGRVADYAYERETIPSRRVY
jgi:outer membrane protein assembly factor BamE (lipoprotein component of BamABCDE complex)